MHRIEVNVETGEQKVIELTPEEIAELEANAATIEQSAPVIPTKEELMAKLIEIQSQLESLE